MTDFLKNLKENIFKEFKGEHSECIKFVGKNNSNFGFRKLQIMQPSVKKLKMKPKDGRITFRIYGTHRQNNFGLKNF